jgi:hypothetical protein
MVEAPTLKFTQLVLTGIADVCKSTGP